MGKVLFLFRRDDTALQTDGIVSTVLSGVVAVVDGYHSKAPTCCGVSTLKYRCAELLSTTNELTLHSEAFSSTTPLVCFTNVWISWSSAMTSL